MTDDDLELLGTLVDRLDNAGVASALLVAPETHLAGVKGIVEEVRDALREFLVKKGFNPWSDDDAE